MRRTGLAVAAGVLLALFGLPSVASAAPTLIASDPEDGEQVHEPVEEVVLTFDMPLDPSASTLVVVDECGKRIDDREAQVLANRISVGIAKDRSGLYEVQFRATPPAGATGSTSGSISFEVHPGKPCIGIKGVPVVHGRGHGSGDPGGRHQGGHEGGSGPAAPEQHAGTTHSSGSTTHVAGTGTTHERTGHAGSGPGSADNGGAGHSSGHGGDGGSVSAATQIAAPGIPSLGGSMVPASTIALSLGLCLMLGLVGGWIVRQAGTR